MTVYNSSSCSLSWQNIFLSSLMLCFPAHRRLSHSDIFTHSSHQRWLAFSAGELFAYDPLFPNQNVLLLCFHYILLSLPHFHIPFLSVCLIVCLSICLSVYLSVCLSVCLSICLSVCLSVFKREMGRERERERERERSKEGRREGVE